MSEFKITGENGKTTTFTFKFDNGLPTKTIINPAYDICAYDDNTYALYVYLSEENIRDLGKIEIRGYANSLSNKEIWFFINDKYLVLGNINDKIIEELNNARLAICFYNKNKDFIKGIKLE